MLISLEKYFSLFDILYLLITILSLIKCFNKGFILSILSASKWLLTYLLTLFLFPKIRPFVNELLDNQYVLDILLFISLFVLIIFLVLLINKGLSKAVKFTGMGMLDKFFGLFFGFVRSYVIVVCLFTTINIIYNYERWPLKLSKSITFQWVEKGSNYLIKEFPSQKEYENAKEKIEDI
tara:strand:- start:988 stop:1524 length:537 start_codon:yes stop_codon:yes gene_type:complete